MLLGLYYRLADVILQAAFKTWISSSVFDMEQWEAQQMRKKEGGYKKESF